MRLRQRRLRKLGIDEAANWPRLTPGDASRPRVLVEVKDPAEADSYWRFLGRHGYDVSWCPGPSATSSCVLVEEGHCPLVEQADIVLTALNPDDVHAKPVLEHLHEPDCMKPIIAVGRRTRWNEFLDRFKVLEPVRVRRDLLPALDVADRSRQLLRSLLDPRA